LLTHEEERLAMGRKNLTRCQEHFELSRTIKNLEDYYCSLVAR
jgi:hypothetical protein